MSIQQPYVDRLTESTKSKIKRLISKFIPSNITRFIQQEFLKSHLYYKYLNQSFSQEGEDMILSQLCYGIENGLFIDIGAYHPIKYSNTYKFYLHGWRGINIDAMPNSMLEFIKLRPRDTNLEIGISDKSQVLNYYIFKESGLNTFSEIAANKYMISGHQMDKRISIKTETLSEVLERYLSNNSIINFMSIDTEGYELEVLLSNNWSKFRPEIVVIESLQNGNKDQIDDFMFKRDYRLVSQTPNNLFYTDNKRHE